MAKFKQYGPRDRLDRLDENEKTRAIEALLRSTPRPGMVTASGIHVTRGPTMRRQGEVVIVRIDGMEDDTFESGRYSGKEMWWNGDYSSYQGRLEVKPNGRQWGNVDDSSDDSSGEVYLDQLFELNGRRDVPPGAIVYAYKVVDNGGDSMWVFHYVREVLYGKLGTEWDGTTASTLTLTPCDVAGTVTGEDDVTVYLAPNKGSTTLPNSTVMSAGTIIPYVGGDNGGLFVMGRQHTVMTNLQVDTSGLKIQAKYRSTWGPFHGSESDWVDLHTGTDCDSSSGV